MFLHNYRSICIFAALGWLASAPASATASTATIYKLGAMGTGSYGRAISPTGQVVGETVTSSSTGHAFLYTGTPGVDGAMNDLGTLGGIHSEGYGINASGQVVGESYTASGATHAFLNTGRPGVDGTMLDLGSPSDFASVAQDINDVGQVVGYHSLATGLTHAFIYTGMPGGGGMRVDLGTLGGPFSNAYAISPNGQVTGRAMNGSGQVRAFLYTGTPGVDGKMTDLGTLGGSDSYGFDINASGQIVGSTSTAVALYRAFLYTGIPGAGGKMYDLGTLGGGSSAVAINASGQIVGAADYRATTHAFIYTGTPGVDGKMIDLDAWLKANNPVEGAKWELTAAFGLTDGGLITGYGTYYAPDGLRQGDQAFLLDASSLVPEPSTVALLGVGLFAIFALKIRTSVNRETNRRFLPSTLSPASRSPAVSGSVRRAPRRRCRSNDGPIGPQAPPGSSHDPGEVFAAAHRAFFARTSHGDRTGLQTMRTETMSVTMKHIVLILTALLTMLLAARSRADTFGSGANTFDIDFVTIGNPENPGDKAFYAFPAVGSVPYAYRIGRYEISEQMIDKADALGGLGITKDTRGPNKPATNTSWIEAAKFVNWLNTSSGYSPAYKIDGDGRLQFWQRSDPGYDPSNTVRNILAQYFIPSIDEWHKAAYYHPQSETYFEYPTGTSDPPKAVSSGFATATAVYFSSYQIPPTGPADITQAGGLNFYGTMAQGGNAAEWNETNYYNKLALAAQAIRGGDWLQTYPLMSRSSAMNASYFGDDSYPWLGFRVASVVPEPSTIVLLGVGLLGILLLRIRSSFNPETNRRFSSSRL